MPEFHNYSQFVAAAYIVAGVILLGSALFFWLQLKKNETSLQKKQSKETAKN